MIGAFLLKPDMTGVVVGQLDDQHAFGFGKRRRDLLDELLLPLNVHRGKQFVLMDRLKQVFILGFALILGIGERGHVTQLAVDFQLRGAAFGKFEQFLGRRHPPMLCRRLDGRSGSARLRRATRRRSLGEGGGPAHGTSDLPSDDVVGNVQAAGRDLS